MHLTPTPPAPVTPPALVAPSAAAAREALSAPATPAPLILFGRDERGRPHASRFSDGNRTALEAAARLMAFNLAVAESDALRDLVTKLPGGRLFPGSGKAFVPFTSAALYDQLLAATGTPDAPRPVKAAAKAAEGGASAGAKQGSGRVARALAGRRRRARG